MRFLIFALSILAITSTFAKEEELDDLITYHPYYVPQKKNILKGI